MPHEMVEAAFAALQKQKERGRRLTTCTLYGSEPLMEGNEGVLRDICEHARAMGMKITAITNGYDLAGFLDLIEEFEISPLQITVDGVGEQNDCRRQHRDGVPTYERIMENIGLANTGVRKKTGIEIVPRWRHPVLVDRMVSRLERSGLCLPDKGNALRRWVRIQPGSDPYIQTVISHYKLSYEDGAITEAKAYLQQNPYPLHALYPKDRA